MADGTGLYAEAPIHAALAALVADARPILVFDRSGSALRWTNAAGAGYLGLASVGAALAWHLPTGHPVARRVGALYDMLSGDQERVERLALPHGPLPRPVITRARRLLLEGDKTVLLVIVDGAPRLAGDPVAAYARFAGLDSAASETTPLTETTAAPAISPPPAEGTATIHPIDTTVAEDYLPETASPEVTEEDAAPEIDAPAETMAPQPTRPMPPHPADVAVPALNVDDELPGAPEAPAPADIGQPAAITPDTTQPAFSFPDHGRAVRFVFELDSDLAFRFISAEFIATVGSNEADIVGRRWTDLARRLDLDPRQRVAGALDHRDTFTGLTVDWPVQANALRVPIDLSGMPVFGRNRVFSGYRGFGVIKTGAAFAAEPVETTADAPEAQENVDQIAASVLTDVSDVEPTVADAPAENVALPDLEAEAAAPVSVEADDTPDAPEVTLPDAAEVPVSAAPEQVATEPDPTDAADNMVADETATDTPDTAETTDITEAPSISEAPGISEVPADDISEEEAEDDVPTTAEIIASPIIPRPIPRTDAREGLSKPERDAFDKIAAALTEAFGARLDAGRLSHAPEPIQPTVAQPAAPVVSPAIDGAAPKPSVDDSRPPVSEVPEAPTLDMALLDRLPVALAVLKDGEIVHANRAFFDLAGYDDLDELSASGGFSGVFEGSALPRDASIPAIRRKDGVEVPVSAKLHAMEYGEGFASLLVVQETAVTTSRERLATAEQRVEDLEAILDTATDGVLVLDQRGLIIGANRSAEALFGVERSHMIGAQLIDHLAPESHRAALDYLDGLTRNGLSSVLNDGREVIGRVAGGGLVPVFMTIGRVSLTKFCAVLRDITQWKRAEEELTSARRAAETASSQKSDFLAKMSHEIRTPLNAIIGFSEVMMEERFGPIGNDRYKEYLRDIHVSGTHIMSLVNDLLDLSKIEAGKLELNFEAVGLNDVVRECAALMQPQANRERIIIRTSLSSSLPPVVADNRSLRQIILNLVSNAIKFNSAGGQVIVSTLYEETGEVVLRVRDTGQGMSETDVVKALEPFRQLATTRTSGQQQGTGLGLPLTKALVEANRASFRIDSTPGQGTLIQITFPSTRVLAE